LLTLALLGAWLLVLPSLLAITPDEIRALIQRADAFAKQAEWDKACEVYESVLRIHRDNGEVKERYHHCLRRLWQVRRHHDLSYTKEVLTVDYGQALRLYTLVRDTLLDKSLERQKLDPARLFRKGLEELDHALGDPFFCQQYIPQARLDAIAPFRAALARTWGGQTAANRQEALKHIREIALTAESELQLSATVVIMELTCGACYASDEYTVYLTPHELRELCQSLKGEMVGVGLTFRLLDEKVVVQAVAPNSPAAEALVRSGDSVMRVDRKAVATMPPELVKDLVDGPLGSAVEVEIASPGMVPRTVQLRRRALFLPSVAYSMFPDNATGYLRIACFQDTTVKETDEALGRLAENGMKVLVLDLRGNGGGLFDSSIDVARRFLSSGVITSTQHQDAKFNNVYHARNAAALALPVVVLIDGETASAAEVLAGALKDNNRATLVGLTTFGKGCTQTLLRLPNVSGGLPAGGMRLTVARFFSPRGLPYTGRGVLPDVIVERSFMSESVGNYDPQLTAALAEAGRQLMMR
jgi:carboxyl-terminal processing protease